jgi:uncharacterized protein (TIGR03437 family)
MYLLALFAAAASAQPETLALSSDGAELYFYSDLQLREEARRTSTTSRIYRYSPVAPLLAYEGNNSLRYSGVFLSTNPDIQGQYCTQAQLSLRPIFFNGLCVCRQQRCSFYLGESTRISRNGRFLFQSDLLDLETGQLYPLPDNLRPLHHHNALSDDGTLLTYFLPPTAEPGKNLGISLVRPGEPQRMIYQGGNVSLAAISPDGRYAFVRAESPEGRISLIEIDISTNAQRTIFSTDNDLFHFSLDSNASHVLIRYYQALSLWDRTTNTVRRLADTEDLIRSAVLSDDGSTVAYQRNDASIHRINTASSQSKELYAATPAAISTNFRTTYPGSAVIFNVRGFRPDADIRLDGEQVPLLLLETASIQSQTLQIQIPFEFPLPAIAGILRITQPNTPFVLYAELPFLREPTPGFFNYFDPEARGFVLSAALEDFSALVSRSKPAPAGSIIHAYLGGLGPLDQPVATGEPGPFHPPAKPLASITCELRNLDTNSPFRSLEIPTLIYAPGLIGAYQADLSIPADWPSGYNQLRCRTNPNSFEETRIYTQGAAQ